MAPAVATYAPRDPSSTVLYHVIAEHLETFLASLTDDSEARIRILKGFFAPPPRERLAGSTLGQGAERC